MIDLITRDAGWKLFSLLVALVLWLAYARDPEVGTFVSAPVEYRGMPDGLEIGSDLVGSVTIDLLGPANKIENFNAAKSAVVLDFSDIHKPGERTFQIDERNNAPRAGHTGADPPAIRAAHQPGRSGASAFFRRGAQGV